MPNNLALNFKAAIGKTTSLQDCVSLIQVMSAAEHIFNMSNDDAIKGLQ